MLCDTKTWSSPARIVFRAGAAQGAQEYQASGFRPGALARSSAEARTRSKARLCTIHSLPNERRATLARALHQLHRRRCRTIRQKLFAGLGFSPCRDTHQSCFSSRDSNDMDQFLVLPRVADENRRLWEDKTQPMSWLSLSRVDT